MRGVSVARYLLVVSTLQTPRSWKDFVWSMPAPSWEGRPGQKRRSGTSVQLSPSKDRFPWLFGVAEQAGHLSRFFLNPPSLPPTQWVGTQRDLLCSSAPSCFASPAPCSPSASSARMSRRPTDSVQIAPSQEPQDWPVSATTPDNLVTCVTIPMSSSGLVGGGEGPAATPQPCNPLTHAWCGCTEQVNSPTEMHLQDL